jgi:hypothetical protein
MLARYLKTRPTRYAMDPNHAAAMRNFLALQSRAYDLTHLAHQAAPHLQHPLLQQLLHAVLGEDDHQALGPLLDVAQDEAGLHPLPEYHHAAGEPQNALIDHLDLLHHALSGRSGVYPLGRIHRQYAPSALRHLLHPITLGDGGAVPDLLHAVRQAFPQGPRAWNGPVSPITHAIVGVEQDDAALLPNVYDALMDLQRQGHGAADPLRGRTAGLIRSTVLPRIHREGV